MKIVVIISTNGGVLSRLLTVPYFKDQVTEVIADRECGALDVARRAGIRATLLHSATGGEFSDKLLRHVDVAATDLFISFYTRLFAPNFVVAAKRKIINLHPSILPACPGMDGFGDTVRSGSTFIGSTIHFVDDGVDTGAPIIQSAVPFDRTAPQEVMRHAIFVDQCRTLLQVVKWMDDKRLTAGDGEVSVRKAKYGQAVYSPKLDFDTAAAFDVPYGTNEPAAQTPEQSGILDLRTATNHPLSLQYSEMFSNCLLTGVLDYGRSQPGFGLTGHSPFVLAAKAGASFGVEAEGVTDAIEAVLWKYYSLVTPRSAADWLGVTVDETNPLASARPWGAVFPWRARSLASYQQAYEKAAVSENGVSGAQLDISHGWLFCGPVSREKCRVEAMRITYVLREISRNGYKRSNGAEGDVKATALVKESGEWRWLITAGNHRAAAASALGFTEIPIRVNLVIHRHHVRHWPHTVDALYTETQALAVFDKFFAAEPPPIMAAWLEHAATL